MKPEFQSISPSHKSFDFDRGNMKNRRPDHERPVVRPRASSSQRSVAELNFHVVHVKTGYKLAAFHRCTGFKHCVAPPTRHSSTVEFDPNKAAAKTSPITGHRWREDVEDAAQGDPGPTASDCHGTSSSTDRMVKNVRTARRNFDS